MPDQSSPSNLTRGLSSTSARAAALRVTLIIAVCSATAIFVGQQLPALAAANVIGLSVHVLIELGLIGLLCAAIYVLIYRNHLRADRAAAELRRSETRYRAIAEMVTDFAYGVAVPVDQAPFMDWANEALSKITGYAQADLLSRVTLRDLVHPDDRALFDVRAARLLRGEPFSGNFRICTQAGDIRWIHDQAQPVWNTDHTRVEYIYGASQDITAQRHAEDALRASEERLRRITDNMLDMVSQTDAAGRLVYVSPSHVTVLGYPPDQLVGRSVFELVHPADLDMAMATYQTALANRSAGRLELRYQHANGDYLWIEIVGNPMYEADGTLTGVTLGSRDITARRQYDDVRTRHARDLAALYETTLAINEQPNLSSLLTTIIERALNLAGASMGGIYLLQADGQTLRLVANVPINLQHTQLRWGEGLAGRVVQTGAALMVPDYSTWEGRSPLFQSMNWGRILAVPLKLRGNIIGTLDVEDAEPGLFEDSTVRVISLLADQAALAIDNRRLYDQTRRDLIERRRIEEQLRDSEARYREVIENIGEGITVVDQAETVVFANPAAYSILGVEADQLVGRNLQIFTQPDAIGQIRPQTALRRVGQVSTYEVPIVRADGPLRTLLVTARPRFDADGRYLGAFGIFRDITERKQAEEDLTRVRNDLARRNEQLTQILEASNIIRSQLNLDRVLHEIAEAAYRSLGFRVIALNLVEPATNRMRIYAVIGADEAAQKTLDQAEYDWAVVGRLLQDRFRRGRCYFVPQGEFDWERDFSGPYHDVMPAPQSADADAWQPEDALIVPIELRSGEIAGLLWPDGPVDGRRPSADTLRLLEIFAAQAAIALETAHLFEAERARREEVEAVHQQVQQYAHLLEQRVADRTAELDRQRQRLQTVLDAAGEGIQILDTAGYTEYVNPATERLTGYPAADVLGRSSRFLLDESLSAIPAARDLVRAFHHGEAWQGELVNRRRDGTFYDTAITLTPLTDRAGTLIGFVAVHSDVTRFRELDRLKDQFVSRIGHELRTPAANIKLYLELLERSKPERYPPYVQTLHREADRLRRLIDGFLEMA
ncbi:MAG: PAS domain S-box protein, partial [Thermoflexales bacterium]|nr:PAS domain S-box protein [Thermoflexales bacterium]